MVKRGSMFGRYKPLWNNKPSFKSNYDAVIIGGGLHEFIDKLQTQLNDIGDAVDDTFFDMQKTTMSSV